MEAPKQKSPDEIRAEELRRTIENAAKESREAREKLEAFMKAEKEGAAIKPASQEENLKPEVPSEKKKWGPLPQSPFMALGVLPGAPKEVVDEAYKKKAKEYFPDQPDLSPAEKKEAEERTKIINEARKLLTDPTFEPSYFKNFRIEDNLRRSEEGDTRIELWKEGRVVRRPDDRIVPVPKIPPIPQTPPTPPVTPNLVLPRRPRGPVPPPTPPAPIPQAPKRESWIKKSWKHVLLALGIAAGGGVGGYYGAKKSGPKETAPAVGPIQPAQPSPAAVNTNIFTPTFNPTAVNTVDLSEAVFQRLNQAQKDEAQKELAKLGERIKEIEAKAAKEKADAEKLQAEKDAKAKAEADAAAARAKAVTGATKPVPKPIRLPGGVIFEKKPQKPASAPVTAVPSNFDRWVQNVKYPTGGKGGVVTTPHGLGAIAYTTSINEASRAEEARKGELEANKLYERIVKKAFPIKTKENWDQIKDKNASEFLSVPPEKEEQIGLYNVLKEIGRIDAPSMGLAGGVAENLESYLQRMSREHTRALAIELERGVLK